jgi:hypothetical protein
VWEWLIKQRESNEVVTCGMIHKQIGKIEEDELLGYLEQWSTEGVIGLFPGA